MFDIMFMRQKRNETARLIWIRATRTVYPLGFKLPRGASSLEQDALLSHASTKQSGEIQCEALEFSDEHKCVYDLN